MAIFSRRRGDDPSESLVYVGPTSGAAVVVFGEAGAIAHLGQMIEAVPEPFVRGMRKTAAVAMNMVDQAEQMRGGLVQLTPEAQKLLEKYEAVQTAGGMLGVVKDSSGQFAGQLTFVDAPAAMANASSMASTAALQVQMAAIERKLEAIHSDLGYLIDSKHIDVEAELAASMDILNQVFDEVTRTGDLNQTQWDRVVNIESAVRQLHHRTSGHLRSLEAVLEGGEVSLPERVKTLNKALRDSHSDTWLDFHVHAERALTQWEMLYLLKQVNDHPDRVDEFGTQLKANVVTRHKALVDLAEALATYLTDGGHVSSWLDKFRLISQAKLQHLMVELEQLLESYRSGVHVLDLGHAAIGGVAEEDLQRTTSWDQLSAVIGEAPGRAGGVVSGTGQAVAARVRGVLRRSGADEN